MKASHGHNQINSRRPGRAGFSLIEVLCVIAIIGVFSAVAVPVIRGLDRVSATKSMRNAQLTSQVSNNLTALNVAHVLPSSLGGAKATARLIKLGIEVPAGMMEETYMGMPNLNEEEILATSTYLDVESDGDGLRLEYDVSGGN